ncbi:MAG: 6-phosphogluconolactonase [Alphaproteobacteria bacterium]|nr:MAG: 6-phosphogluconolactonase [Alphaproteobacteria bacterium]
MSRTRGATSGWCASGCLKGGPGRRASCHGAVRALSPLVPFDVCVLGLGVDGHIASLIPDADGFAAAMRGGATVLPIHAPGAAGAADRLSLTFPAIASSRLVVLLFSGAAKRAVFENALAGGGAAPIVGLLCDAKIPIWAHWCPEAKP